MIEIRGLTKIYKTRRLDVTALSEVDLVLPSRGLVAIYGENGCGKTTLLNILATADTDYKGSVSYDGIDYRTVIPALRRNVISFVLQEEHFIPYLNLSENLALFGDEDAADATRQALARYELSEKEGVDPKNLSGGQKQRSSIIRGILKKSEVLLVDEPTSSLNEEMEAAVFAELKEYAKEKLVVLVSHNIRLIRANADLIIHMDKGRIGSVESNAKNDLRYDGTTVSVPRNFFNLSALDPEFVKASLTKSGELTVKARTDEANEEREADYRPRDTRESWVSPKPIGEKRKRKLVLSSLLHIKGTLALGISIVSLFAILISFLFSFAYYNENVFIYESLTNNLHGEYIKFANSGGGSGEHMTLGAYLTYKKQFPNARQILNTKLQDVKNPPVVPPQGTIYRGIDIDGVAFCNERDVTLLAGEFCGEDEIMLTDFVADTYVTYSTEYDGYDAILEKGIELSGRHFPVSGIVDTNYERFIETCYTSDSVEWNTYLQNGHRKIYRSLDAYLSADALRYMPSTNGTSFWDISAIEENGALFEGIDISQTMTSTKDCYVNEALAASLGSATRIKTVGGDVTVKGVVSDGREDGAIYVYQAKLEEMRVLSLSSIDSIMTVLESPEEIAFLRAQGMEHYVTISRHIRQVVDIISKTSEMFLFLAAILSACLVIAVLVLAHRVLRADLVAIALLKSGGYSTCSILSLEAWKLAILFVLSSVLGSLLYPLASVLLNARLSSTFEMVIHLSILEPQTFLLTNAILLGAFLAVSFLSLLYYSKKRIITLLS